MNKQQFALNEVASTLKIRPHRITYALASGFVPEPKLRLAGKRVFEADDIERLKQHFKKGTRHGQRTSR